MNGATASASTRSSVRTRSQSGPPGDQRGLDDLAESGGELLRRQRPQHFGIGEHSRRLVVGADVVLRLGKIDAGLTPVGGVDLRDERRRHLNHRDAALVDGGAEAGEVADHAATEGQQGIVAAHAGAGELAEDPLGRGHGLLLLPARGADRVGCRTPGAANRSPGRRGHRPPRTREPPGQVLRGPRATRRPRARRRPGSGPTRFAPRSSAPPGSRAAPDPGEGVIGLMAFLSGREDHAGHLGVEGFASS